MNLEDKQSLLVEELGLIPDAYERLGYIVELGKRAQGIPEALRIDQFKIEGCLSQLWVIPEFKDQKCHYKSESDSAIVKGIAELLCTFFSEQTPKEILSNQASFLSDVGITQHLSPNRRNGLSRIVETIHRFAVACQTQLQTAEDSNAEST